MRNCSTVHRQETGAALGPVVMDGTGNQLFARAALALQEHGRACGGNLADHRKDLLHGRATANHVLEIVVAV